MNKPLPVILQFRQVSTGVTAVGGSERYQIQVVQAPGYGWGGPMSAAEFDEQQLQMMRTAYRGFVTRQLTSGSEVITEWQLHPLRVMGSQLFQMLPESIQSRIYQAQGIAHEQRRVLQLILIFEKTAQSLLDLPWELLHQPESWSFFALRGGGVTRQLLLPTSPQTTDSFRPQAILGVWAEPLGVPPLKERHRWGTAPDKEGEITWIQGADSLGQLQRYLEDGSFDSLHVVAHGRSGAQWNFSFALVSSEGEPRWCSPDEFATFISHYPDVRFVYLDVCASGDGGEMGDSDEALTGGGAATHLLGAGLSAVVVMQDRVGQAASGLMADIFYRKVMQGASLAEALTDARRMARLQQGDVIHWSVPALYTQQKPPEDSSPLADTVLNRFTTPAILAKLFAFLVLGLLVGRLSWQLAQTGNDGPALVSLLLESNLVVILSAVITYQGQLQVGRKFHFKGREWIPFLQHKYFSVMVWSLMAWIPFWMVWLGVRWSGIGLGSAGQQILWLGGLTGLVVSAHIGARQAIRQHLLFYRVGFSLFKGTIAQTLLILILLFFIPFAPLLFFWGVQLIWITLGLPGALIATGLSAVLLLLAALLYVSEIHQINR